MGLVELPSSDASWSPSNTLETCNKSPSNRVCPPVEEWEEGRVSLRKRHMLDLHSFFYHFMASHSLDPHSPLGGTYRQVDESFDTETTRYIFMGIIFQEMKDSK